MDQWKLLALVSISIEMSYCKISKSLKAMRLGDKMIGLLWNLTSALVVMLLWCLPNFRAIRLSSMQIQWLQGIVRSYDKNSNRYWNRPLEIIIVLKWNETWGHFFPNIWTNLIFCWPSESYGKTLWWKVITSVATELLGTLMSLKFHSNGNLKT